MCQTEGQCAVGTIHPFRGGGKSPSLPHSVQVCLSDWVGPRLVYCFPLGRRFVVRQRRLVPFDDRTWTSPSHVLWSCTVSP